MVEVYGRCRCRTWCVVHRIISSTPTPEGHGQNQKMRKKYITRSVTEVCRINESKAKEKKS